MLTEFLDRKLKDRKDKASRLGFSMVERLVDEFIYPGHEEPRFETSHFFMETLSKLSVL